MFQTLFKESLNEEVTLGLYCLMQVIFIYNTWFMEDGSSILDNINYPACIRKEIALENRSNGVDNGDEANEDELSDDL